MIIDRFALLKTRLSRGKYKKIETQTTAIIRIFMNRFGHFRFLYFFDFENIVSSSSSERCLRFLGFDELVEICLFVLPFIDFPGDILERVSSKNARLFSLRRFFATVLIFSPFATSCNTSKPVVKADFPISFNDGLTLLATLLKILLRPYHLRNIGLQ